jgi:hypothetical protein
MAPHTDLAPVLIVAACAIGSAPAVSAQTVIEAKTWDDAISKLECKDINKNADGSFSVPGIIKINGEDQHHPIINVPKYKEEVEAKKC